MLFAMAQHYWLYKCMAEVFGLLQSPVWLLFFEFQPGTLTTRQTFRSIEEGLSWFLNFRCHGVQLPFNVSVRTISSNQTLSFSSPSKIELTAGSDVKKHSAARRSVRSPVGLRCFFFFFRLIQLSVHIFLGKEKERVWFYIGLCCRPLHGLSRSFQLSSSFHLHPRCEPHSIIDAWHTAVWRIPQLLHTWCGLHHSVWKVAVSKSPHQCYSKYLSSNPDFLDYGLCECGTQTALVLHLISLNLFVDMTVFFKVHSVDRCMD